MSEVSTSESVEVRERKRKRIEDFVGGCLVLNTAVVALTFVLWLVNTIAPDLIDIAWPLGSVHQPTSELTRALMLLIIGLLVLLWFAALPWNRANKYPSWAFATLVITALATYITLGSLAS